MEIIVLDGYAENPGDFSWAGFEALGGLKVYDRTPTNDTRKIIRRIAQEQIVLTNKRRSARRRLPPVRTCAI